MSNICSNIEDVPLILLVITSSYLDFSSSSDSFWTLLVTSAFSFEDNQYCSSEEGKILGVCSSFFS